MSDPAAGGIISHFADIAGRYDVLLCDIWGVVHNGLKPWPEACDALQRFRAAGGRVCLITNAPRPTAAVVAQLDAMGAPDGICDAIATSGDVTRELIETHDGRGVFHLGPERDRGLFDGIVRDFVGVEAAQLAVITGLDDDDVETPADYEDTLQALKRRSVEMVCANPDIVVERGDRLVYCAGALAQRYEEMGGSVVWAGKPYAPIYEMALKRLGHAPGGFDRGRALAIGDSARTDIAGAIGMGFDALFVASGIHAAETVFEGAVDARATDALFAGANHRPTSVMHSLAW